MQAEFHSLIQVGHVTQTTHYTKDTLHKEHVTERKCYRKDTVVLYIYEA